MTTKELDKMLMGQYTVESMLKGSGERFRLQLSDDENIAGIQLQAPDFCMKSKGFLCSHYVSEELPEAAFAKAMKNHMDNYRVDVSNRENQAMKWLYNSNIGILSQQISMLAMHAQFKDVRDMQNVSRDIAARSLNPEGVSVAIALYIYYTLLENSNIDALSYNELFVKSWYLYYENWQARRLMFQLSGNDWKVQFEGVLLE